jgi:hypothetical protein
MILKLHGTLKCDFLITRKSSGCNSSLVWPSIDTLVAVRAEVGNRTLISTLAGRIIGRKESECGAIGGTQITYAL